MTASARLVIGAAFVALPHFHISYLRGSSSFKILTDNIPAFEVELQVASRALHLFQNPPLEMLREESVSIDRRFASIRGRGDSLSVAMVSHVTRREDSGNISLRLIFRENVAF
jgi:hypothetical protein